MEIEQYFFADEVETEQITTQIVNGHHINIYLRNSFIESCKLPNS